MFVDSSKWLCRQSPAFRLMVATSWLAPEQWRDKQQTAIQEALACNPDWNEYLDLVTRHRTPVLSWTALQMIPGLRLSENVRQKLEQGSASARMHALQLLTLQTGVLKLFQQNNIPILVLKGPFLSLQMYGDFAMRQSRDLDIACKLEDFPRACVCLQNFGWQRDVTETSLTPLQNEKFLRYEHHASFMHPKFGDYLELHWGYEYEDKEQIQNWWQHSTTEQWQGFAYQTMRPDDLIFFLCQHGSSHVWIRLKWLGDLARLQCMGKISWDECIGKATSQKRRHVLLATRELLRIFYRIEQNSGESQTHIPSILILWPLKAIVRREITNRLRDVFHNLLYRWHISLGRNTVETIKYFSYSRQDYLYLSLRDKFFWLYLPLRPLLWLARHAPAATRQQSL